MAFEKKYTYKKTELKTLFQTQSHDDEGNIARSLSLVSYVEQKTKIETGEVTATPEVSLILQVRTYSWDIKAFYDKLSVVKMTPDEAKQLREFFLNAQSQPTTK